MHNAISSQRIIILLVVFLCASCKFITSSFSEIAFKVSAPVSTTASPSSVLTGVSSTSDMEINISESGTDNPCSHLETVCRTTLSLTASSCCESHFDFMIALMFSLSIKDSLLSFSTVIVVEIARCHKQRILTSKESGENPIFHKTGTQ